jgi:hypothetical protein
VTEQINVDLFAMMDAYATAHMHDDLQVVQDDKIFFIGLVKAHRPDLSREERDILFDLWREHNLAKLRAELSKTRDHLIELDRERRKLLFGGKQGGRAMLCACGVMLEDAFDRQTMIDHRPHMIAAGIIRGD